MHNSTTKWIRVSGAIVIASVAGLSVARSAASTPVFPNVGAEQLPDAALREEMSRLLAVRAPAPLLAARAFNVSSLDGVAGLDSIVIAGDTMSYPALSVGGFLNDEVQKYNRWIRRIADRASRRQSGWLDSVRRAPPGLLTVAGRRNDRAVVLVPTRLGGIGEFVHAPAPVLFAGSQRQPAFVDQQGTVLVAFGLHGPSDSASVTGCSVGLGETPQRRVLRCTPRNGDGGVVVRLFSDSLRPSAGLGGAVERGAVWLNSTRVRSEVRIADGDLVQLGSRSFVFVNRFSGLAIPAQWINGRVRVTPPSDSTLRWLVPLASARTQADSAPIRLSLEQDRTSLAQSALEEALRNSDVEYGLIMVADVRTGDIVAFAQTGDLTTGAGRLRAFEPAYGGSVVKPLHDAAILSQKPELLGLRVRADGRGLEGLLSSKVTFDTGANHCPAGVITLAVALACSSNAYHVAMTARGASVLATGLEQLFGHRLLGSDLDVARSQLDLWRNRNGGLDVPPILRPAGSRLILEQTSEGRYAAKDIVSLTLGARAGRWTPPDLLEGFIRVVSGRRTLLGMIGGGAVGDEIAVMRGSAWHEALLDGLHRVVTEGTGRGILAGLPAVGSRWVLAKTGTLNEADSVRTRTLLLGIGERESASTRRLGCGLAVLVHAKHASTVKKTPIVDITVPLMRRLIADGVLDRDCAAAK